MANNKVQLADGTTLIDLTQDTVTPEVLASGYTAHDSAGEPIVGTASIAVQNIEAFYTVVSGSANTFSVKNGFPTKDDGTVKLFGGMYRTTETLVYESQYTYTRGTLSYTGTLSVSGLSEDYLTVTKSETLVTATNPRLCFLKEK